MSILPAHIQGLILDMDGVLWRGETPIGDLPFLFERIRQSGRKVVFATNNSTRSPQQYVEKLAALGVKAQAAQIITSSLAVTRLMAQNLPPQAAVFAIGEDGLQQALSEQGFKLLSTAQASLAQALVIGIDRNINFEKMAEAALLIRQGKPFYATNPDKTFPTPRGEIPGAGSWYAILVSATGKEPIVAGKPETAMMELALERLGLPRQAVVVVGDRLETDILAGQAAGCLTALVLSGVSTRAQGEAHQPKIDFLARDLTELAA